MAGIARWSQAVQALEVKSSQAPKPSKTSEPLDATRNLLARTHSDIRSVLQDGLKLRIYIRSYCLCPRAGGIRPPHPSHSHGSFFDKSHRS